MKIVEVFKTDVEDAEDARKILAELTERFPGSLVNFDLEDCDRVLRVEHDMDIAFKVKALVIRKGFYCEVMES